MFTYKEIKKCFLSPLLAFFPVKLQSLNVREIEYRNTSKRNPRNAFLS